jgi:hypothetical protein
LMAAIKEEARDRASDVSCTPRYKKLHKKPFPLASIYDLV